MEPRHDLAYRRPKILTAINTTQERHKIQGGLARACTILLAPAAAGSSGRPIVARAPSLLEDATGSQELDQPYKRHESCAQGIYRGSGRSIERIELIELARVF